MYEYIHTYIYVCMNTYIHTYMYRTVLGVIDLAVIMKKLLAKYDNMFEVPFPYSMAWHGIDLSLALLYICCALFYLLC